MTGQRYAYLGVLSLLAISILCLGLVVSRGCSGVPSAFDEPQGELAPLNPTQNRFAAFMCEYEDSYNNYRLGSFAKQYVGKQVVWEGITNGVARTGQSVNVAAIGGTCYDSGTPMFTASVHLEHGTVPPTARKYGQPVLVIGQIRSVSELSVIVVGRIEVLEGATK